MQGVTMTLVIVFIAYMASALGACPNIVSRADWGARPPNAGITYLPNPVSYVMIHHSETLYCSSQSACIPLVQQIQNLHMDIEGLDDIAFNFLIGGDSNAYEGRGWDKAGQHATGYFNTRSIAICFIGSFMSIAPQPGAISAAKQLIQCGVDDSWVTTTYSLIGHIQAEATTCPGDTLYNEIKTWDHYDPTP